MQDDLDKLEKKVSSKTKLEQEKEEKLKAGEFVEELEATGQENEDKAAKWIKEVEKANEKKVQEGRDEVKEFLKDKSRFKTYEYYLARLLYKAIKGSISWPKGFQWRVTHNERGVAVIVKDPNKQWFSRGFKPAHHPDFDLNAVQKLYWACENLIQDFESNENNKNHKNNEEKNKTTEQNESGGDNSGDQEG